MPQINPSISEDLDKRLDELTGLYEGSKTLIAKIAMAYGASHFKKAWQEYGAARHGLFRDADDAAVDDPKVALLPPSCAAN